LAGVYNDTRQRVGGAFHPMRNWIDQLRVRARVVIVILASAIVIIEIAEISFAELGKVVFENAVSASWW
jgi:hypothetical protein